MSSRLDSFLQQIKTLGAIDSSGEARRAAIAALRGLSDSLPREEAPALAALLDEALAAEIADTAGGPHAAVAAALEVGPERALVVTRAVMVAALEVLGSDGAPLLAKLPPGLQTPALAAREKRVRLTRKIEAARGLAAARPGSANSLADGSSERAHRHSLVAADDPHADTRISSARGLTKPGRTLADARSREDED